MSDIRCPVIDPVWDRRCVKACGHDGPHQNDEVAGETVTWGTVAQIREHEGRP